MEAFEIANLMATQQERGEAYLEFIRVSALSVGLYTLPAGGVDRQLPHTEDEVYYIISGQGMIRVGEEERAVQPGSTVYVAAGVEHRFFTIAEDLTILVFFAPAEGTFEEGVT